MEERKEGRKTGVSDTANACVHCGYKFRKSNGAQPDKNKLIICGVAALAVIICLVFIILNLNNGIEGTWRVDYFIIEGEKLPIDKSGENYGSEFEHRLKQFSVKFNKDGSFILQMPGYNDEADIYEGVYTVNDGVVSMDVDGVSEDLFVIKGKTLIMKGEFERDMEVLFKKQ